MKKIVSLITVLALFLQLGIFSAFAVPAEDKSLFKDTSEIFGIYDCSYTHSTIFLVRAEGIVPYTRDMGDVEFYEIEDYTFTLLKYQLASDHKSVTAYLTTNYDGVQYKGQYTFRKDGAGRVFFSAVDYQDKARTIYKSYEDSDSLYAYVESPAFNKTLLAENGLLKKVAALNTQKEKREAVFQDAKPISSDNYLYGYYANADENQYVKFSTYYDYNPKDYSNFYTYTNIVYAVDTKTYYLEAKSFIVKNGVATYLEDSKNYIEISAPNRGTITNIKVVKNGKVVSNQKANLSLSR